MTSADVINLHARLQESAPNDARVDKAVMHLLAHLDTADIEDAARASGQSVRTLRRRFQPATGLWKRSSEISYYLSNRPIDASIAADAIRRHWHIENRSHHVRDVTLGEDASRIRTNPGIFARLRSFAANILRFNQIRSVRQDRYAAALGGYQALTKLRFS